MLRLCHWGKFLVYYEEIPVTHANGDAGALVVVSDGVGPAFEPGVSDLAPGSDIPDAKDAILADSEKFCKLRVRSKPPELFVVVRFEEYLSFLALAGAELHNLSSSGSDEDLARLWMLAHALDLRIEGLDVRVPQVARSLLGELPPCEAPDYDGSVLAARNKPWRRTRPSRGEYVDRAAVVRRSHRASCLTSPLDNTAVMATRVEQFFASCLSGIRLAEDCSWGLAPARAPSALQDTLVKTVEVHLPCAGGNDSVAAWGEADAPEGRAGALARGDGAVEPAIVCGLPGKDRDAVVVVEAGGHDELPVPRKSNALDAFREWSFVAGEALHGRGVPDTEPRMAADLARRAELPRRVGSEAEDVVVVL